MGQDPVRGIGHGFVSEYLKPDSQYIREPMAEFFGTMILVIFGCGANCQVALSSSTSVSASPKGVSFTVQAFLKHSDTRYISNTCPRVSDGLSASGDRTLNSLLKLTIQIQACPSACGCPAVSQVDILILQ